MHSLTLMIHAVHQPGLLGMSWWVWVALAALVAVFLGLVLHIRRKSHENAALLGLPALLMIGFAVVVIARMWTTSTVPTATAMASIGTVDRALLAKLNAQRTVIGFPKETDPSIPSLPQAVVLRDMVTHTAAVIGPWHMVSFALAPISWRWDDYGTFNPTVWSGDFQSIAAQDVGVVVQQWHTNALRPATMYQDPELGVTVIPLTAREAHALQVAVPALGSPTLYNANASWQHMAVYVLWGRSDQ